MAADVKRNVTLYVEVMGILLATLIEVLYGEKSCGTLKYVFVGSEAKIRWYPESWLGGNNDFIFGVGHRWLKDGSGITLSKRITFDNVSLILNIFNFTSEDEGKYNVQCRSGTDFPSSEIIDVRMSMASHITTTSRGLTTTSSPLAGSLEDSTSTKSIGIDTSVAIVVVSICVVISVVVISATIILVCRRRMQRAEDHQRLADKIESPLASRADGDGASVYNEIDLEYESSSSRYVTQALPGSPKSLNSPSLPKRPGPVSQNEPHYSTISKSTGESESCNTVEKSMYMNATRGDKHVKTGGADSKDLKNMYASVIPKEQRINRDKAIKDECSYAKPIPKKDRVSSEQGQSSDQGRYSVTFPKIDMTTVNTKIAEKEADLVSLNEENFEAAICRSGVYRSQRRKSSKHRQLNYVEIDHSGAENKSLLPKLPNPPEKLEYVSIDFDKKAFVAPTRKPPSSWYKRRNKKKR